MKEIQKQIFENAHLQIDAWSRKLRVSRLTFQILKTTKSSSEKRAIKTTVFEIPG